MDTWATSSVTPQIVCGWERDPDLFARTFPMDLRPQAHDIIRTWLFSTVLRAHLEHDSLPWRNAAISGWVLDPDRKKMSKSKGNVVTPLALLEEYGSDGVRYWAARGGPGVDTAFDAGQMKVGRRLAIKLLNASKFALAGGAADGAVTEPLDRGMLRDLAALVDEATAALEDYEYARVLERTESFFWSFCDDYLELVKSRRYGDHGAGGAQSANRAMQAALSVAAAAVRAVSAVRDRRSLVVVARGLRPPRGVAGGQRPRRDRRRRRGRGRHARRRRGVLGEVRRAKSEAKRPLKAPIAHAAVRDTAARLALLEAARADVCAAAFIQSLTLEPADAFSVSIEFAEPDPALSDSSRLMAPPPLPVEAYRDLVARALAEDIGAGDVTTALTVDATQRARGMILAKTALVLAGLDVAARSLSAAATRRSCSACSGATASRARRAPWWRT